MLKKVHEVSSLASRRVFWGMVLLFCGPLVGGCVVLEDKYNAEKTRSLNFQRLLAQEEKRTAELDSEVKRTKNELAAFEARNRELTGQVQSLREQMGRLQEEAEAIKEATLLERKALEDMRRASAQPSKPKKSASPDSQEIGTAEADLHKEMGFKEAPSVSEPAPTTKVGTAIHVVRPGETLFRISRRYGIEVDKLKKLNKLPDDIIEVGQKLIVGTE